MSFELMLYSGQNLTFINKNLRQFIHQIVFTVLCVLPSPKFVVETYYKRFLEN